MPLYNNDDADDIDNNCVIDNSDDDVTCYVTRGRSAGAVTRLRMQQWRTLLRFLVMARHFLFSAALRPTHVIQYVQKDSFVRVKKWGLETRL